MVSGHDMLSMGFVPVGMFFVFFNVEFCTRGDTPLI